MPPCLAVIVPCYNEAGTIEEILRRILARSEVAEVVVVDDGSTDDSWQRLQTWSGRDPRLRLLRHPHNRGKGAAIQTALPHLRAPFVLIQDADLEYDPADYPRLLQPLLEGRADAVYGTRFGPGARARTPLWHRGGNWLLTRIARGLTGLPLTDEATGYKVFRRELLQSLTLQERGFGFCPEVTAKLARLGARVVEVPIHYQGRSRAEGKKIRWRDGLEAVRCLWRYSRPPRLPGSSQTPPSLPHAPAEETVSAAEPRRLPGWVWVLPALAYGWGLVWATGLVPEWGRWYSASPYYRQQVAAMLRGDLALSRDPADLRGDLCWSEGGVHQVWGLGVPLWRLPFELLARALGFTPFPDMLALAAAFVVAGWLLLSALGELLLPSGPGSSQKQAARASLRWWALGGLGACLLAFPPLLRQLRTNFEVYEEAVVYEYLLGLCLIAALLRLACCPTPARFWVLCGLAGYGMWIRPTLVFHGAAAVLAGMVGLWWGNAVAGGAAAPMVSGNCPGPAASGRRRWWGPVLIGATLYGLAGGGLYLANLLRFGGGFEFGHRLNIQPGIYGNMYSTRFDYPFQDEPFYRAAAELFGFLFLPKKPTYAFWLHSDAIPTLSPTPRWREVSNETYDFGYLAWVLAGWGAAGLCLWRLSRSRWRGCPAAAVAPTAAERSGQTPLGPHDSTASRPPGIRAEASAPGPGVPHVELGNAAPKSNLPSSPSETHNRSEKPATSRVISRAMGMLGIFSFLATAALAAFYLRVCVISTRYMMDFMPAFAGGMLAAALAGMQQLERTRRPGLWAGVSVALLAAWWTWDTTQGMKAGQRPRIRTWDQVQAEAARERRRPVRIPPEGAYHSPAEAAAAGMLQHGCGWHPATGELMPCVYIFVKDPVFLELDLEPNPQSPIPADPHGLRAKVGLEFLRLESVEPTPEGWRVRFAGPRKARYQRGIQPVFLATVPRAFVHQSANLPWRLVRVRWREPAPSP